MRFEDWLSAKKMTSAAFARLSGIEDRQAVHKYRHGERFPTAENLLRIRKATGGEVTADDFVDQHVKAARSSRRKRKPNPTSSPPSTPQALAARNS